MEDFNILLEKVGPKIMRSDTNCREAIPPKIRLLVTLRFLATGDSYHSLMYLFKISEPTISRTVPEVCQAIIEALPDVIKVSSLFNIYVLLLITMNIIIIIRFISYFVVFNTTDFP